MTGPCRRGLLPAGLGPETGQPVAQPVASAAALPVAEPEPVPA